MAMGMGMAIAIPISNAATRACRAKLDTGFA
jgi:hypothetical protein